MRPDSTPSVPGEELAAYAAAFLPAYEARKTGHTEIAFIQKDYPAYCRRFGFRLPLPDEEVEYAVLSRMEEVEPEDGVEDALGVWPAGESGCTC